MKSNTLTFLLTLALITSLAGCVYYFKLEFARYSIRMDSVANIQLEIEQPFRVPRVKPLKIFRPPKVIPGFIVLATTRFQMTEKFKKEGSELKIVPTPDSLQAQLKKVEQIEELTKKFIRDGYVLAEMNAFSYVSTTLAARLLACYNYLGSFDRRSQYSNELRETIKNILVENSEVIYFEIMITFEDTFSAFPDMAVNFLDLVEGLNVSSAEKVAFYSAYLNRRLSERVSPLNLEREKSIHIAMEKLRTQGLDENQIKSVVENFISKNAGDPRMHRQAISISKSYFPDYFESEEEDEE